MRLAQLAEEQEAILSIFPNLQSKTPAPRATKPATDARPVRKRRPMTAAQRADVSRRMRAYWAARRKREGR